MNGAPKCLNCKVDLVIDTDFTLYNTNLYCFVCKYAHIDLINLTQPYVETLQCQI